MKLRLLDDSIRLRLSRTEVVAAHEQGVVESQTRFPDGSAFAFALETLPTGSKPSASYASNRMTVRLPAPDVAAWANDDAAVSLRSELELPAGVVLKLLVEKDFKCLAPSGDEDQSDQFANPQTAC